MVERERQFTDAEKRWQLVGGTLVTTGVVMCVLGFVTTCAIGGEVGKGTAILIPVGLICAIVGKSCYKRGGVTFDE